MSRVKTIPWLRISVEAAAIVVSILLAFAIQAWWELRQANEQRLNIVAALSRDFQQMAERTQGSIDNASRAATSGSALLAQLSGDQDLAYESAMQQVALLARYEVFSPSVGAYESLVSSGGFDLLVDDKLKRELASFFGSFDDMRVSEQILISNITRFWQSPEYTRLVGFHRLPRYDFLAFNQAPVEEWKRSDFLKSFIALITLSQNDVIDDYRFLQEKLRNIQDSLQVESSIDK